MYYRVYIGQNKRDVPEYNNKQQQKLSVQLRELETKLKGVLAIRKIDNLTSPSLISSLTFFKPCLLPPL